MENYQGHFVRGYFKAPITSDAYKFYVSADDSGEFWLAPQPKNSDRTKLVKIANSCAWKSLRNYYYWNHTCDKAVSSAVSLQQNEYYYFEFFHVNWDG